jgi:hypothetical protein
VSDDVSAGSQPGRAVTRRRPRGLQTVRTLSRLEEHLGRARGLPLSATALVERAKLHRLAGELPAALATDLGARAGPRDALLAHARELEALVSGAKPIPCTQLVRIDRATIERLCDEIRFGVLIELGTPGSRVELDAAQITALSAVVGLSEPPATGLRAGLLIATIAMLAGTCLGVVAHPGLSWIAAAGIVSVLLPTLAGFWPTPSLRGGDE